MMFYLQLSLCVLSLRFPAWIIMQHHEMLSKKLSLLRSVRMSWIQKEASAKGSRLRNAVCAAIKSEKLKREYKEMKLGSAWNAIEISFFSFIEGMDAFALVQEICAKCDYFARDKALTHTVLSSAALTLVIISITNLLSMISGFSRAATLLTRLLIVILSNLPFFVIRLYMMVSLDSLDETDSIFIMFTIKETLLLVLAGAQVLIGLTMQKHIE